MSLHPPLDVRQPEVRARLTRLWGYLSRNQIHGLPVLPREHWDVVRTLKYFSLRDLNEDLGYLAHLGLIDLSQMPRTVEVKVLFVEAEMIHNVIVIKEVGNA